MNLAPDRIFLHDPCGVFENEWQTNVETVMWSEDRIADNDYEYEYILKNKKENSVITDGAIQELREIILDHNSSKTYQNKKIRELLVRIQ